MFTATDGHVLPTTVTGSWPRPFWFQRNLSGRPPSDALLEALHREEFTDAVAVVVSDQERAGLDIVTNGDYHLDNDLAGLSWMRYPVERMRGVEATTSFPASDDWVHPPGTLLAEAFSGWRLPSVTGSVESGTLEFDKLWRIAQMRTERPVKFGTVSTQLVASMLELQTDKYALNRRELMWDMATVMNRELRRLADAGCKVIQIEEPLMHLVASSSSSDQRYVDFLVECFNHEISGLDDVEVWVHTCWGNASMQRVHESRSYAEVIEVFLERVGGDVWTVEMKDRDFADLELFRPYRNRMTKKIAIGVVSHRTLQVETPDEVAADIRYALEFIAPEDLVLTSDCGFGRQGSTRAVAFYKAAAIAQGANIVRRELGAPETEVRAASPRLQMDLPRRHGPAPFGLS